MNLEQQKALALAKARRRRAEVSPNALPPSRADVPVYDKSRYPQVMEAEHSYPVPSGLSGWANVLGQSAARGVVADNLGAIPDIYTAARNTGAGALNATMGSEIDMKGPTPVGGDAHAERLRAAASAMGLDLYAEEALPPMMKKAARLVRGGAGALGLSGLMRRLAKSSAVGLSRGVVGRTRDSYNIAPVRMMAGDTAAGAGSMVGAGEYEDRVLPEDRNAAMNILYAAVGGVGGGTLSGLAEGAVRGTGKAIRNATPYVKYDRNLPRNPDTGLHYRKSETAKASREYQGYASNKDKSIKNIKADRYEELPPDARPRPAATSEDVGLAKAEEAARNRDSVPFIEHDQRLNTALRDRFDSVEPKNARTEDFTDEAARLNKEAIEPKEKHIEDLTARIEKLEGERAAEGAPYVDAGTRAEDASRSLDATYLKEHDIVETKKRAMFKAPEIKRELVEPSIADDAVTEMERTLKGHEKVEDLPTEVTKYIRRYRILEKDPETGKDVFMGNYKRMTMDDVDDLRTKTSLAIRKARANNESTERLENLKLTLKTYMDDLAESGDRTPGAEAAKAANDHFSHVVGPRMRDGWSGDKHLSLKRDRTGTRNRPSETGKKALGKTEDAESLSRAIDYEKNPASIEDARTNLLGSAAGIIDKRTGFIRPQGLRTFMGQKAGVIDTIPGLKGELDVALAKASKGERLSGKLVKEIKAATKALKTTEAEVSKSAFGIAMNKSPREAAVHALKSKENMRTTVRALKGNDAALDGLKGEAHTVIRNKLTTSDYGMMADKTRRPINFEKLDQLWKEKELTLAEMYSPLKMNILRQFHKAAKQQQNLKVSGSPGPRAGEMSVMSRAMNVSVKVIEAALRLRLGMLKGGGVASIGKRGLAELPDKHVYVKQIIQDAHFDPDVAIHLLDKNLPVDTFHWNARWNRYFSANIGARESLKENDNGE